MDLLLSFLFSGGLISVIIIIAVIALFFNFVPLGLWISAIAAGVNVGIFNLIGMRLRRVPAYAFAPRSRFADCAAAD